MTIDQLLALARSRLVRLTADQTYAAVQAGALLIDIRAESQRLRDGEIPHAIVIDRTVLEWRLDPTSSAALKDAPDFNTEVIILCNQGYSSSLAAATLQELGFAKATDVIGGLEAWREAGLPLVHVDSPTDGLVVP